MSIAQPSRALPQQRDCTRGLGSRGGCALAVPIPRATRVRAPLPIKDNVADALPPASRRFHDRRPMADQRCRSEVPPGCARLHPTIAAPATCSECVLTREDSMQFQHRSITTNGIKMHVAEAGSGPLVVMCHGFPESWYSWRHQLAALAEAGFHAVAPDMRGYGQTESPEAIDQFTLFHLVGDVIGVLDALGESEAVIVGHDWGAPVAWHAALIRPDRFRGVVGLSVPYRPRQAGTARPTSLMPQTADAIFYQLYFQQPGVAEAEFERDHRQTVRSLLYAASGEARASPQVQGGGGAGMVPRVAGFLGGRPSPSVLPAWITEADVDFYAHEFRRAGFRGGLNWYRNIDKNWELLAPWIGAKVVVPALYIAGDRDLVLAFRGMDQLLPALKHFVPNLRETIILSGCGHWTQQERPQEVNAAVIKFLRSLG